MNHASDSIFAASSHANRFIPLEIPLEILLLLGILGLIIFLWDLFDRHSKRMRRTAGLPDQAQIIAVKGSAYLPGRRFFSSELGIESQPDALLQENGLLIPVDFRPTSNKVRDRHVVQMLVHLRLIEMETGKQPSYGILLLGNENRLVKIKNTEEKQRWVETIVVEMRAVLGGIPAVPTPAIFKCKSCDVRAACSHSAYRT